MIELRRDNASVARGFSYLLSALGFVTLLGYLAAVGAGKPWSIGYIVSLLVPFAVVPLVVWFAFVPRQFRYDQDHVEFPSRLSRHWVANTPNFLLRSLGSGGISAVMAEIRTVTTLRSKQAEIQRAIVGYEQRLAQARADLSHVIAAIAIFEASGDREGMGGICGHSPHMEAG